MVKHTKTIRRILPTNCLSVFDHFVGLLLKAFSKNKKQKSKRLKMFFHRELFLIIIRGTLFIIVLAFARFDVLLLC